MRRPRRRQARRHRRRTVRVSVEFSAGGAFRCAIATTLGAGGLFIQTESPLAKGTPLQMRFRLPGGRLLHEIEGRVAWSHRDGEGDPRPAGMGVQFKNPFASSRLAGELEQLD